MANADAAAGSGALPNWVMLERFIFRRDDPKTFREDRRTSAIGETSVGAHLTVSFILAEPPTPSRLYLSWPEGPKREKMCHLVAAHRNLVLLRLDSFVNASNPSPFGEIVHDYFLYIADPRSRAEFTPVLRRLPPYTVYNTHYGRPATYPFEPAGVGILCCGEQFALAYMNICSRYPESETSSELEEEEEVLEAQVWVFRSTVGDDSTDRGEKWEIKHLPINGKRIEYEDLLNWKTREVVPFKNALCWVDYDRGILYCEDVCGDTPKAFFVGFPRDEVQYQPSLRPELYRSLCVTEGGDTLALVDVSRHDGAAVGRMLPDSGFTIVSMALTKPSTFAVDANELWATHPLKDLPHEVMMVPMLSMDEANVAHFVLYDWAHTVGKVSLVTIDLRTKRMIGSVVPYINGKEDLSTDDADMVKAKPGFFMHFLPTEFPKFLNLHR
ncbi:unnamed protein product [Urochloa decumbens]|uniref:DUF1618 domain-containing protein n=1 Tax=Urochloa decumbens TaxID=240449 RepID=A0ABC9FI50_9POAL